MGNLMKTNRRNKIHASIQGEIKAAAWKQIAERGAPALSLRAIAREMEVTAPALYRYFPDRDALVTALIVEAFTSLGDALSAEQEAVPLPRHAERLFAVGVAYRGWAVAYPQRYQLIFGTPIPGYEAPAGVTVPAAARALNILIQVLDEAIRDRKLPLPQDNLLAGDLPAQIEAWRQQVGSAAHPYAHYLALIVWSRVHGLVSLEIGQQYPPTVISLEDLYRQEIRSLVHQIGFE
jgi:AcrR family transcriptional regulator